ncbi:secondary thiamine-phosphate synthase enzyme YjbQ [Neptuniibacter sp. QD34_54]|uniref:secondary thiamine-phosphate synthase enzyme YjbQ n=1 Tax=Neptuniibacter sp. QD34_54 TaxID=3398208 RepID=UPI0039F6322D
MVKLLTVNTGHQGLFEFTRELQQLVEGSGITEGLCTLLIQHTSASLIIQENADPSAKQDLEAWLNRLVPERDSLYTHTLEGVDDMPAHIKSVLTSPSLSIPVLNGRLCLGTWQGVYCWEHRHCSSCRQIAVHIG